MPSFRDSFQLYGSCGSLGPSHAVWCISRVLQMGLFVNPYPIQVEKPPQTNIFMGIYASRRCQAIRAVIFPIYGCHFDSVQVDSMLERGRRLKIQ